jgi:hypothetical protein
MFSLCSFSFSCSVHIHVYDIFILHENRHEREKWKNGHGDGNVDKELDMKKIRFFISIEHNGTSRFYANSDQVHVVYS